MKTFIKHLFVSIFLTTAFVQVLFAQRPTAFIEWEGQTVEVFTDHIIVYMQDNQLKSSIADQLSLASEKVEVVHRQRAIATIRLEVGADIHKKVEAARRVPGVVRAGPSVVMRTSSVPNDPDFSLQYGPNITKMPRAWKITTGDADVLVGVIDSGIPLEFSSSNLSHEDLNNSQRILLGEDFSTDDQGVRDLNGHGTHVTGILSAETNNQTGIAGSTWNSKILVVKFFDAVGEGESIDFLNAVEYAVDEGVDIINFSGGATADPNDTIKDAVEYAYNNGVLLVAAAGNESQNNPDRIVEYPAAYSLDFDNVIAVSATDDNDLFTPFSSFGDAVNLSAPGDDIYSTMPDYQVTLNGHPDFLSQNYSAASGTSQAAPHVAGTAALMLSVDPTLSPSQLRDLLEDTADGVSGMNGQSFTYEYGHGRLNAYSAVKYSMPKTPNHHFASTQTLSQAKFISGNSSIAGGSTLTVDTCTVFIVEGDFSSTGSNATIRVEGLMDIDPNANLNGVRIIVEPDGILYIRPNVTMDNNIAAMTINGTATIGSGFSMKRGGLVVNEDATLNMYGADIEVHKGGTDGLVGYGPGSVILRGEAFISGAHFHLEDGSGTWGGVQVTGPDAAGSSLANVLVEHANFGISLNNTNGIFLDNIEIDQPAFDGIRASGSSDIHLTGLNIDGSARYGVHLEGGYLDAITNALVQNSGSHGFYADGASMSQNAGTANVFRENTGSGIFATGQSDVYLNGSSVYDNQQPGGYQAQSVGSSHVSATHSWWGHSPVDSASTFNIFPGSSLDWSLPLPEDPNPVWRPDTPGLVTAAAAGSETQHRAAGQSESAREQWYNLFRQNPDAAIQQLQGFVRNNPVEGPAGNWRHLTLFEAYAVLGRTAEAESWGSELLPAGQDEWRRAVARRMFMLYVTQTGSYASAVEMLDLLTELEDPHALDGSLEVLLDLYFDQGGEGSRPAGQSAGAAAATQQHKPELVNYPNPFNPTSVVQFTLPETAEVRIDVYNAVGQRVATLARGTMNAGTHTAVFDGTQLASGLYLARMQLGDTVLTRNMMLIK